MTNTDELYWEDASAEEDVSEELTAAEMHSDKQRRLQARRRLEQYQEERRLRRLIQDVMDDPDELEYPRH